MPYRTFVGGDLDDFFQKVGFIRTKGIGTIKDKNVRVEIPFLS